MSDVTAGEAARDAINKITTENLRGTEATQLLIAMALLDVADAIRALAGSR